MKNITGFNIDVSDLSANKNVRQFIVNGEEGAEFILQVFDSAQKFYNFNTKLFSAGVDSQKNLEVTMGSEVYNDSIIFPADDTGLQYTLLLITPKSSTQINIGKVTNSHSVSISQVANAVLSFNVATGTTGDYATFESVVTSSGSPSGSFDDVVQFDRTIATAATDAGGFGLRLIRQPVDTDWYYGASDTVSAITSGERGYKENIQDGTTSSSATITLTSTTDLEASWRQQNIQANDYIQLAGASTIPAGTYIEALNENGTMTMSTTASIPDESDLIFITPSDKVIVNDLTGIVTGMVLTSVSGNNSFLVGTPKIIAINTSTNEITLSSNQGFFPGVTLNFRAEGSSAIEKATGAILNFDKWVDSFKSATNVALTKTVRTTATGTTVELNGTYGISGGGFVSVYGVGFINTSANTVQSVSASSSAGSMVMQVAQTVRSGTVLTFSGSAEQIKISNKIGVKKYPTSDTNIFLNLDNFITTGVGS
jgi:hypothetical protein